MDTHNTATTPTLTFATHPRTRDPLTYRPADHGHALILAPPGAGRSSMLHRLVRHALTPTGGYTIRVCVLDPLDNANEKGRAYATGARVASMPADMAALTHDLVYVLKDRQTHGYDPTSASPRFLVFVDDADDLPHAVVEHLARFVHAGPDLGIHLVVVAPGPIPHLVGTDSKELAPYRFRAARRISLDLVRLLVAEDGPLIPAPIAHGRWLVAQGPDQLLVWEPHD